MNAAYVSFTLHIHMSQRVLKIFIEKASIRYIHSHIHISTHTHTHTHRETVSVSQLSQKHMHPYAILNITGM